MSAIIGHFATDQYDSDPDDDFEADERTPPPDFGCACEDALIVDTVCPACISYLAEQDRLARKARP